MHHICLSSEIPNSNCDLTTKLDCIYFHNKYHFQLIGVDRIFCYLFYLARKKNLAASTPIITLFIYRQILPISQKDIDKIARTK